MYRWSTELKVGVLMIIGLLMIGYGSVLVTGWKPGQGNVYKVNVFFDNSAGLLAGSPVQIAGVKVGAVDSIALSGNQAKITLAIVASQPLYADSIASIKSLGILGDKFVAVHPGTSTQSILQGGDTILRKGEGGNLDSLVDNLSVILGDIKAVTGTLRQSFVGEAGKPRLEVILSNLVEITNATNQRIDSVMINIDQFTGDLSEITYENRDNLRKTLESMAGLSKELQVLMVNNRKNLDSIIGNLNTFSQALAKDGPSITSNLNHVLSDNRTNLNRAVTNLDSSLYKLNNTMGHLESISSKVDKGKGSVGKLINDDETVDNLNTALAGINRFLDQANRFRIAVGGEVQYLSNQEQYKSSFDVKLQPLKDRYYMLQLVSDPRGVKTKKDVEKTTAAGTDTETTTTTEDELQVSALLAQRYYDTELRGGIMENSFGAGIRQFFGRDEQYSFGMDAWKFGRDEGAYLRLAGYWRFFSNAYISVGGDDLIHTDSERHNYFIGAGVHFEEEPVKPLLSSITAAVQK